MPGSDENSRKWLLEKLRGPDVGASERQVELVDRFCELYAGEGLFSGELALPLDTACPSSGPCWDGVPPEGHPPRAFATASVPWVGSGYGHKGVAAIAINFNRYGGLGAQWWVRRGGKGNEALRAGKRPTFAYRAGSYLAAVHASLAGHSLSTAPAPSTVADAWERSAFLEAVKCSPYRGVTRPTPAMWSNCPRRYLSAELALLEPGTILAIGRGVGEALKALLRAEVVESASGFWRAKGLIAERSVNVLCCNHPSYGHWRTSLPSLISSLEGRPLYGRGIPSPAAAAASAVGRCAR